MACSNDTVYDAYIEVPNNKWHYMQQATFNFSVTDTLAWYDMFINVRNTGDYPYQNLYIFTTLKGPNHLAVRDTFNCILADKKGNWLGSGIGKTRDLQILYQKQIRFLQSGNYTFVIEQAMRDTILSGISDIGFTLKKHTELE
jgi:gliding motility-associated lipoprotein GldH